MNPLFFTLPESFDPGEFLTTPSLRHRGDDARYFVNLIQTKLARGDDEDGWVYLRSGYLKNIMHQPTYAKVRNELREGGATERSCYQVGRHPFGYRLADRFAGDRHVRVPVTDERLIGQWESFIARRQGDQEAVWQPVHYVLAEQQRRLKIHGDQARDWLSKNTNVNPFDTQGILVRDIEDGEFRLSVGQYDRVFNSISNMKRELRRFLHVDGGPLGYVDLRCCQPALIARLCTVHSQHAQTATGGEERGVSHYDSSGMGAANRDVHLYRTLVESGELYDVLKIEVQRRGAAIDRDEVKRQLMCDVIAKRGKYPSRVVEQAFGDIFPTVLKFIRAVNRHDHGNLIRQLHREEARLVIETVAADLVARFPGVFFLTLHDAIYATAEHLHRVEQAFHRAFDQTGFAMSLETKHPTATALSPATKPTAPDAGAQISVTNTRITIRDSDQDRATTLREPEWVSSGIGLRWPRLAVAS